MNTYANAQLSARFNDSAYADRVFDMRKIQIAFARKGHPREVVSTGETVQDNQVVICEHFLSSNEGFTYCMDRDEFNATSLAWKYGHFPSARTWEELDATLAQGNTVEIDGYTRCLVECNRRRVLIDPEEAYKLKPPLAWGEGHDTWKLEEPITLTPPEGGAITGHALIECHDGCFPAETEHKAGKLIPKSLVFCS